MGGSCVDEHDEGCGTQEHLELYCVADGHLGDHVQGENQGCRVRNILGQGIVDIGDVDAVDVEDSLAYAVVPPRVLFVAVEAEALPSALLLLR